jgi:hypothetical protein
VQAVEPAVGLGRLHRLLVDGELVVHEDRGALGGGEPVGELGLEQQVAVDDRAAAADDFACLPQRGDVVLDVPAVVEDGVDVVTVKRMRRVAGDHVDVLEPGGAQVLEGAVRQRTPADLDEGLRLLRGQIAEPRTAPGGQVDDGELRHDRQQ